MSDSEKKIRKIPFIGRVATESTFRSLEAEAETMIEAQDRIIKRAIEDMGWNDVSQGGQPAGLSDLSPKRRQQVVQRAVRYWLEDPLVGGSVDLYTYYIFGRGLAAPRFNFNKAQTVVNDFWNDKENQLVLTSYEAQLQKSAELQLQGNVYLTLFINEDSGEVKLSDLLAAEVDEIISDPSNRKKHLFYRRTVTPMEYDFRTDQYSSSKSLDSKKLYHADWRNYPLPEGDPNENFKPSKLEDGVVYHVSINRLSDGKFGNPRVLRILDWAYSYNQFMRARVSLMEAAAWLAWKRKAKGDPTQIRKLSTDFVQKRFNEGTSSTGDQGFAAPGPARFGAMITENENTSLEFVKTDTASGNAKNDGQMLKSQVASGIGFPLHYLGDMGGANLATATAMELPVLKMCESGQEMWEGVFTCVVDKVLEVAIAAGVLPRPSHGKFSDVDAPMAEGGLRRYGFDSNFVETMLEAAAPDDLLTTDGNDDVDITTISGDVLYAYELSLPPILQRQLSETINSVVNMLGALDPQGQNDDLARWAYDYCLQTLNVHNASELLERVMPKGKDLKRGKIADRGVLNPDLTKAKRPDAASTTGGPTRAWTPEDHARATTEAETNPAVESLKVEFAKSVEEIHGTLTDELIAAMGSEQLANDSDTE